MRNGEAEPATVTGPSSGLVAGKIVVVTGGASGIGRAAAEMFAAEGAAHVVVVDVDEAGGAATADSIGAGGRSASIAVVDVTDEAAVEDLMDGVVADHGRIDVAFNNAGVTDSPTSFQELDRARWDRMLAANLTSVFLCMKHELGHMARQGSGAIVNTSSGAGLVAAPFLPHYTAAKHGVVGLTRAAAAEYVGQGVRVNSVLPGTTDSAMTRGFVADHPEMEKILKRTSVTGDFLDPGDIAAAVVWLGSDAAVRVNGQSLVVDGGGILH